MSNLPAPTPDNDPQPISQDAFQVFLANQAKELALKEREIELERERMQLANEQRKRGHEFAMRSLEAAEKSDVRQSAQTGRNTTVGGWIAGIVIVGVLAFAFAALFLGKEQILAQLLQLAIAGLGGGGAGYAAGYNKGRRAAADETDSKEQAEDA
jgi:hypothetical protein